MRFATVHQEERRTGGINTEPRLTALRPTGSRDQYPGCRKATEGLYPLSARYHFGMSTITMAGKVAIVTGATRGVGAGIARELARSGARVFATGRTIHQGAADNGVFGLRCDHT